MRRSKELLMTSALLAYFGGAHASEPCTLALQPETSGFFLNPVLEKVIVAKATGAGCLLMAKDEILQLNEQVIPGQRARTVMSYWKSLGKDSPRRFKVRRAGQVLTVSQ